MVVNVTLKKARRRPRINENLIATELNVDGQVKKRRKRRTKQEIEAELEEPYYPTDGLLRKDHNYFSFVVAECPKYVPGSGPPLAPLSVMLPHDSSGFIIDKRHIYKKLCYVVGFTDHPELKITVPPPDILDYVSPRNLEDWENGDYVRRVKEEEKAELQKRLEELDVARVAVASDLRIDGRKRKRAIDSETETPSGAATPRRRGRPFKKSRFGPGRKNEPSPEPVFTSPKRSFQTSLSVPIKSFAERELEDEEDSEDDEEDSETTDAQLQAQLIGANLSIASGSTTCTSSPVAPQRPSSADVTSSRDASAAFEKFVQEKVKPAGSSHASPMANRTTPAPIPNPLIQNTRKATGVPSHPSKSYKSPYPAMPTTKSYSSARPSLSPPGKNYETLLQLYHAFHINIY